MSVASSTSGSAKAKPRGNPLAVAQWSVVLIVGILIVVLITAFNLIPRLDAGQQILNTAKPLFNTQRLDGTADGVNYISSDVDMANPLMTPSGQAAAEVPQLIAFLSTELKVPQTEVVALLEKNFPHTTNLLESLPFTAVTAELPKLETFLETELKLTPTQLDAALQKDFPSLFTVITTLPKVTAGWNDLSAAGVTGLTRFDGTPVTTVPQLRDYFQKDVVPALASQQKNFESLDSTSALPWIPVFLLVTGAVVILLALVMIVHSARGPNRNVSIMAAWIVPVVGVVAIAMAIGLKLNSRVDHGQYLLDGLKPAFQAQRVDGAAAGVDFVGTIVTLEQQIMTPAGGASNEVPKLVAFLSTELKVPQTKVLALMQKDFPHTTALLQALPLTAVSAELPQLEAFLETKLKLSPTELTAALEKNFPALTQTIVNAPTVTAGWDKLPAAGLTRFDGTPVTTGPELATYLHDDVIPVLGTQQANFEKLLKHGAITWIGIVVLSIGIVATEFGLLMVWAATKLKDPKDGDPKQRQPGQDTVVA